MVIDMAVLPMQKIEIYGLNRNRKQILEYLQRVGCVEIETLTQKDDEVFYNEDISTPKLKFENAQKSLVQAVEILNAIKAPETSMFAMFEGRKVISEKKYREIETSACETVKIAKDIVLINKKIADIKADIARNEASIESITPWKDLDIGMRAKETEHTAVFIGTLPVLYDEQKLKLALAEELKSVDKYELEIVGVNASQTCVFVVCHKKVCHEVENALRNLGFSYPAVLSKKPPKERIEELNSRIKASQAELVDLEKSLDELVPQRENLLYCHDYYEIRLERYENLAKILKSSNTFAIKGYITAKDSDKVKKHVEAKFVSQVEITEPNEKDDVPVKLKNNGFAAPVEGIIESYSLPGKGEIDPAPILAIFYYVLFGLMFSDAGYGLLMILGCGYALSKYKNMNEGLKNSVKMFLYCGISTAFWGLMFGSFFGDFIDVLGSTFFNAEWSTPCLWYNPIDGPMTLLMLSLLFGVIHLFTGLGIKFYLLCKAGHVKDAIFDVGFWYLLVGGGILYFMSMQMFADISGLGFVLPPIVATISSVMAGVGALGIIATAGRSSKSAAVKVMKGLYGLYGATSYLSDILSYSRLLALGLATGVIATVFNQIASMGGNNVVGVILFIFVFLVGHALNFGLNVLGAYVHSNRLEYVEFFGKFYEGGGRKFNPFKENTKYFNVSEEN